jgi:type I restriction enzyme S subunit
MKAYPKYKPSNIEWIGEIPEHWEIKKLKYLVEGSLKYGANESAELEDTNLPRYIRITDFGDDGKLKDDTFKSLPFEIAKDYLLEDGDILFARSGATVGKTFQFKNHNGLACFAGYLIKATPNEKIIFSDLLYLFTKSNSYENWKNSIFIQATIQNIGADKYDLLQIPIPPIPEQQYIIRNLIENTQKIDTLSEKKQRIIELLKEERTAIINQAVTKGLNPDVPMKDSGIDWLGEIPESWKIKKISIISQKITNGYVGPTRDILKDSGIRYLQSLHMKNNHIIFDPPYYVSEEWSNTHSRSILQKGDVLIVQTGDIGQVVAVGDEFVGCNCHALIIITPKKEILGEFLSLFLNSNYGFHNLKSIQTGALLPHLNSTNVKDIRVLVPNLKEQYQIIDYITSETIKKDNTIAKIKKEIALLQEYRTASISEVVTGKIDVREVI